MGVSTTDWTLRGLDNPDIIQHQLLQRFEKDTGTVIVDNNNPACVIMEAMASLSADQMKMMDEIVRPAIYPARAVDTMDLLKHISDYDYNGIFSMPCTATIMVVVETSYIMTHSVDVIDPLTGEKKDYKKLVIPRSTQITIGEHVFGLYYPIEIRSRMESGAFTVLYVNEDKNGKPLNNPLKGLETNVLDFDFREFNGHKLAYIKIPVYQFKITNHDLQMVHHAGFKRVVDYTDRFYALRCWAEVLTNPGHDDTQADVYERRELELAVAGQTYDPTKPTVVFTPDEENKECTLEVPYVYFMENLIRGTLHVELYTTEGELNYKVPYNTTESCVIDMFTHISEDEDETYDSLRYAEPFRTMPALNALPLNSTVAGGSNGMTFEQLRDLVINGVETNVLQTPKDIEIYFAQYGYTVTLYRDGITDRIFIVHTAVRDNDNAIIAMDTIPTQFDFAKVNEIGTIVKAEDSESTYTVLPSTLYRFDKDRQICLPLTDSERSEIEQMTPEDKVNAFNTKVFTLSPFHLQINAASRYPTTITYDMLQCKRLARTFIASRDDVYGLALNTVNLDLYHKDGALKDGYRMTFRVSRVGFSMAIPVMESDENGQAEKKIRVLVGLKNDDDQFKWAEAQWVTTERGSDANSTNEVFELIVNPNYIFHQANNEHTVQMGFWGNPDYTDFHLTSEARVILLLRDGLNLAASTPDTRDKSVYTFEGEQCLETKFTSGQMVLPTGKKVMVNSEVGLSNYFAMTEQKCVFQFRSPVDELDQRINLTYSEAVYKKHLTTKFKTLDDPIYKTDEHGNLILTPNYTKVGPETNHKYFVEGVLYFHKVEENYVEFTPEYNTEITERNVYLRSMSPTVEVLFDKGVLTCLSVRGKEQVVLNSFTSMNYLGCTIVNDDDTEEILDENRAKTAIENREKLNLKDAPLTPRFKVDSADGSNQELTGDYELASAQTTKPISSLDNVWIKTGFYKQDDETKVVKNVQFVAKNALKLVLEKLVDLHAAGAEDENPLRLFSYMEPGAFLLLTDDSSTPKQCQLGTVGEEPASKTYTRLYYKIRKLTADENPENEKNCWYCIVQGKSYETILSEIDSVASDLNPKFYGFLELMQTFNSRDQVDALHYLSFLTTLKYESSAESYAETEDEIASTTKKYYIALTESATTFREATDDDFNEDGSFRYGTTYFERTFFSKTYEVPDFMPMEKSAWEKHEVKELIDILDPEQVTVVKDRVYCYKDRTDLAQGIVTWVDVVGELHPGDPITNYISPSQTGDGIYYKKSYATCTDTDYAWEQNANRWPWELTNWLMIKPVYGTDGKTVKYWYLTQDSRFALKADWDRLHRYWDFSSEQVILDEHNKPLEDYTKNRSIQYLCDMLQMDAKLAQTTVQIEDTSVGSDFGPDDEYSRSYPVNVVKILRTHFDNVATARDTMFTNTRLFFEPIKSLGFADFNIGNGMTRNLPLDISMKFRLHVSKSVYEDDILLIQLKKQIVKIIDAQIDSGYVNCAEIASKIKEEMTGSIHWIDVLGIDGDPDLQTMKSDDPSVRPHLAHRLTLSSDSVTIDVERALEIEAVVNE